MEHRIFIVLIISLIFLPVSLSVSAEQEGHSPYSGQERRDIKALSDEEIKGLRDGSGMGMAKAAELNHYPGPKHVLELASELELTEKQKDQTIAAYDIMHEEALSLGKEIIEKEMILDRRFAHEHIDEKVLEEITLELGRLMGSLRAAHLKAHIKMKSILSEDQIKRYDDLRGYGPGSSHRKGHDHSHH